MFLQQWIQNRVEQEMKEDPECRQFLGRERLGRLTRQDLERFQLFKLRKELSYVYRQSAFYRDLFDKNRVKPDEVRTLGDLSKVPFTKPLDLAESPYRFLCISQGEVERVYTLATGGTTGAPKKVFFTAEEFDKIADYMGAAMKTVAVQGGVGDRGYKVMIFLPNGKPESQANLLAKGIEKQGGTPIKIDITLDVDEQLRVIEEVKPDILFGSVSRLWRITQQARQTHDLRNMRIRILFATSEYLSDAMRREMTKAWGSDVYLHYGMTEMGFGGAIECSVHNGFHFNEPDFLFEVADPATGKVLDNNEEGELILTTLNREGMPLIRYRTGDLAYLVSGPCDCGTDLLSRIGKMTKRISALVRIGKGEEIYPSLFDDVLYQIPGLIDYRIHITTEGNKERLVCKTELAAKEASVEERIIEALLSIPPIGKNVETHLMTKPHVELMEPGFLKRTGRAKQRLIDNRSL